MALKVLHVINQFCGRGGAEVSLRDLILAWSQDELVSALCVLKPAPNDFTETDQVRVPRFLPARPIGRPTAVRHVRKAVDEFGPDLVHTSLFEADLAGRLAARWARLPVVTSLVNTTYSAVAQQTEPVKALKRQLAQGVDRILARHATTAFHAITEAVADDACSTLGIPRDRIHVVPRGRSREDLGAASNGRRAAARLSLGLEGNRPVVVNVARQEPQKGQRHLLKALSNVLNDRPDTVLLVVGREGRSSADLRQTVERLGIERSVRWLGVRRDVSEILCAADVFVFPSLWEGLGGAVVEAMALRVPVVASDIPAMREVLDGGRCGTLVPPADPEALAVAILGVLAGGQDAADGVEAAERRFEATYELATVATAMLAMYRAVLGGS